MKATVKEMAEAIRSNFAGQKFSPCTRRNGTPSPGWTTTGRAGFTIAVKNAGLPWNQFWSGMNPTPSTQVPIEIYKFLRDNYS
jgi:hypothetical protein